MAFGGTLAKYSQYRTFLFFSSFLPSQATKSAKGEDIGEMDGGYGQTVIILFITSILLGANIIKTVYGQFFSAFGIWMPRKEEAN